MKSIELTEEHKSKLLEMCKNLFPEQEFYWEYEMYGRGLKEDFNDVLQVYFKDKEAWKRNLFPFNIHWFEFCMTHLCDKISMNLTNQMCTGMPQYYDESEKLDWNSQSLVSMLKECHPIDYLYEEFLKLK